MQLAMSGQSQDVKELKELLQQIGEKYGTEFRDEVKRTVEKTIDNEAIRLHKNYMNYEDQYPNVSQFIGYFHQDWMNFFKWEGKEPSFEPVIRKFKTESERVDKTIPELKDIIQRGEYFEYDEWVELLTYKLGLNFRPKAFGLSHQQWIIEAINILEEPMDKTLQYRIPKRIRE